MADLSVNIGSLMMSNPVMTHQVHLATEKSLRTFVDLEKDWRYHCKGY